MSTSTVVPRASFPWRIMARSWELKASMRASVSLSATSFLVAKCLASASSLGLASMSSGSRPVFLRDVDAADALLRFRRWPAALDGGAREGDGAAATLWRLPGRGDAARAKGLDDDVCAGMGIRLGVLKVDREGECA